MSDGGCRMSDRAVTRDLLKQRTKRFALQILDVAEGLPRSVSGQVIAKQLARCGTSVAANYRAACRARSRAEHVAKLGVVEEEADETLFWLEIALEKALVDEAAVRPLLKEADEIVSIVVATIKTARAKLVREEPFDYAYSDIPHPTSDIV